MILYAVVFIVLCINAALEIYQKQKTIQLVANDKILLRTKICFPVIVFFFLGVFREVSVGYDAQNYFANYWSRVDFISWKLLCTDFTIDNGFFLILKLFSLFTDDWWTARALLFVVTFSLYYGVIKKESPYVSMSLIIFLGIDMLSITFGILRQALAGAVAMVAYSQLRKNSYLKCLILIFVASTIHKTALICVFMLMIHFLKQKKFSGLKLIMLSGLAYGVFFALIPIITLFYASSRYEYIAGNNGGYGKLFFILVVIAVIAYLFREAGAYKDEYLNYLFNLSCGALFVQVGALQWSLLTRTTTMFSIYWCILIPQLISKLSRRKQMKYYFVIVILFAVMFFYQFVDVNRFIMHQF